MAKKEKNFLSPRDLRHLQYLERWATYDKAFGALSLEQVIEEDKGEHFSSILSEEDNFVSSFSLDAVPKANVLLVFGSSPRAIKYAAEVAHKHQQLYGYLPEFVTAGDGRGMFRQRRDMAIWFEDQMMALGFDADWVKAHHHHCAKNRNCFDEVSFKLKQIFCRNKMKVLAITGAGLSLRAAQVLPEMLPEVTFAFFAPKQLELSERLFDAELLSEESYAIDILLANVLQAQCHKGKVKMSLDKKFSRPKMSVVIDFLSRGFAGCMTDDLWAFVGISVEEGSKLYKARVARLQRLSPKRFDKQAEKLFKKRNF